jgi:hypothetical protein
MSGPKNPAPKRRGVAGYYTVIIVFGLIQGWPQRWSHRPLWLTLVVASATLLVIPWIISRVIPARDWFK